MAITWLESDVTWGSSPSFKRSVGYEEIGRTATSVKYTFYLKIKVQGSGTSSSFYGYSINASVDGTSQKLKDASPRWYGNEAYRQFTWTVTKTATASGGTTTIPLKITAGHGSSGAPNLSKTYTVKVSTFNTAPYWSSTARLTARNSNSSGAIITNEIDGTENSVKIAENVSAIYLSWDSASDNEGNISKYELYAQINDGSWSLIYSGSNRYYTHNIGSGNQGAMYDYYVKAIDSYGETSPTLNLRQFQKNQLTGANISASNGVGYSTADITLTWSGASNTNGNTSFTYSVSSPTITIYNKEKLTASGGKISVLKSGTSTNAYVLFEDLKKIVNGNKTGSFEVQLVTKNAYGSSVTKSTTVSLDLKVAPKAPTSVSIGGKVSTSLGSYLIPSRANAVISWSGASDYLGGALSYDVYYKVGTGSEVKVDGGTGSSVSIKLPTPSSATTVAVRVVAKTTFGWESTSATVSDTIHYYNPPSVSLTNYNRTMTSMAIDIYSKVNSSIPSVALSKQSYTGNGISANFTGAKYTATIGNLVDSSAFTFTATVNDNTGLSSDVSASYKVTPATPKLSVREDGVGVNCVNTSGKALAVEGGANVKGGLEVDGVTFTMTNIFNKIYPVGSIYMSVVNTNPSSLFGGTWVAWGSGRVPVGVNTSDGNFNTVEKTGGASTHTLSVAEMPSHTHTQNAHTHTQNSHNHSQNAHTHTQNAHSHSTRYKGFSISQSSSGYMVLRRNESGDSYDGTDGDGAISTTATNQNTTATNNATTATNNNTTATNNNTGGGSSHNNLQPYITCYMWKRTA